jgi:twitching motility protein PilT
MLSESLVAIASQQLVRKKNKKGQIVAMEILLSGAGFSNIVRDGSASKIHAYILSNKALGMVSLDESLMGLVEQEVVSAKDAFLKATNKVEFEEWLKEKEIELEI